MVRYRTFQLRSAPISAEQLSTPKLASKGWSNRTGPKATNKSLDKMQRNICLTMLDTHSAALKHEHMAFKDKCVGARRGVLEAAHLNRYQPIPTSFMKDLSAVAQKAKNTVEVLHWIQI